jgi:transcriptional regulator with XRE-family HTH domain
MSENFRLWLEQELKGRGWSHGELARRASLAQATVSNVITGQRQPGCEFCIKAAQAFGLSPVLILVKAGILPSQEPTDDLTVQEITELARSLPPEDRAELLKYARFRYQQRNG